MENKTKSIYRFYTEISHPLRTRPYHLSLSLSHTSPDRKTDKSENECTAVHFRHIQPIECENERGNSTVRHRFVPLKWKIIKISEYSTFFGVSFFMLAFEEDAILLR